MTGFFSPMQPLDRSATRIYSPIQSTHGFPTRPSSIEPRSMSAPRTWTSAIFDLPTATAPFQLERNEKIGPSPMQPRTDLMAYTSATVFKLGWDQHAFSSSGLASLQPTVAAVLQPPMTPVLPQYTRQTLVPQKYVGTKRRAEELLEDASPRAVKSPMVQLLTLPPAEELSQDVSLRVVNKPTALLPTLPRQPQPAAVAGEYSLPQKVQVVKRVKRPTDKDLDKQVWKEKVQKMELVEREERRQALAVTEMETVFVIWRNSPVLLRYQPTRYKKIGKVWVAVETYRWLEEAKSLDPAKGQVRSSSNLFL
jgi:hypothetical protein